ncbi:hypothetical protein [Chryseolinea lacunae]|uniref:Uncharacterized protein n=1 Tax=Chryseolinea lacunae TaxID=2801331 RepID=A0ABS1KUU1_9BACT|nr:hypothetical protein [Chryseolinea lacunae]MBL0743230.1 hypothetical protein [Chryseolinea lacunae]
MRNLRINIVDQYWTGKNPDNKTDPCSYGLLSITANDVPIVGEGDERWTISTSGLMLLRTLSNDFASANSRFPLIQHCGQLGMIGCPMHVTWDVFHQGTMVTLKNFQKLLSTDKRDLIHFDVALELPLVSYVREVVRFADGIKFFFQKQPREFAKDDSTADYESFWQEFNGLLEKNRKRLKEK